ncbi:hypothetical protein [Desulfobacula sp.]
MGFKGDIWLVHPKKTKILGRRVININPLMLLAAGQGVVAVTCPVIRPV